MSGTFVDASLSRIALIWLLNLPEEPISRYDIDQEECFLVYGRMTMPMKVSHGHGPTCKTSPFLFNTMIATCLDTKRQDGSRPALSRSLSEDHPLGLVPLNPRVSFRFVLEAYRATTLTPEDGESSFDPMESPIASAYSQALHPGLDHHAPLLEPVDWMPSQTVDCGTCLAQYDFIEGQQRYSTNADVDTTYDDGLRPSEILATQNSLEMIGMVASAVSVHLARPSYADQYFEVDDLQTPDISHTDRRLDLCPQPTLETSKANSATIMRHRYPDPGDWEFHRPIITQLYFKEKRKLSEVIVIMKHTYGFNASKKMYNKRIKDWQLFKNQKAAEKELIAQQLKVHKELGIDLGRPMIRGEEVQEHKIARHLREKRKARCVSPDPTAPDSDGLVSSPLPSLGTIRFGKRARRPRGAACYAISFSRLSDPAEYRNTESLLFEIEHYFASKLGSDPRTRWHVWRESSKPPGDGTKIQYVYQNRTYRRRFKRLPFPGTILAGVECLSDGRPQEGWRLIHEAAEMIRPCLSQDDPWLLLNLFSVFLDRSTDQHAEIENLLTSYTAGMATTVHGQCHPISRICHALKAFGHLAHVTHLIQSKVLDILDHQLGEKHPYRTVLQRELLRLSLARKSLAEANHAYFDLARVFELIYGRNYVEACHILYDLVEIYFFDSGHRGNSKAADMLIDMLERRQSYGETDGIRRAAHVMSAFISMYKLEHNKLKHRLWAVLLAVLSADDSWQYKTLESCCGYLKMS